MEQNTNKALPPILAAAFWGMGYALLLAGPCLIMGGFPSPASIHTTTNWMTVCVPYALIAASLCAGASLCVPPRAYPLSMERSHFLLLCSPAGLLAAQQALQNINLLAVSFAVLLAALPLAALLVRKTRKRSLLAAALLCPLLLWMLYALALRYAAIMLLP